MGKHLDGRDGVVQVYYCVQHFQSPKHLAGRSQIDCVMNRTGGGGHSVIVA